MRARSRPHEDNAARVAALVCRIPCLLHECISAFKQLGRADMLSLPATCRPSLCKHSNVLNGTFDQQNPHIVSIISFPGLIYNICGMERVARTSMKATSLTSLGKDRPAAPRAAGWQAAITIARPHTASPRPRSRRALCGRASSTAGLSVGKGSSLSRSRQRQPMRWSAACAPKPPAMLRVRQPSAGSPVR